MIKQSLSDNPSRGTVPFRGEEGRVKLSSSHQRVSGG